MPMKNYLAARGVPASRMSVVSWGKERPEALGSTEEAWAQNRRAVTVIPQ
jgi:peptidoglycan-associated lipoprotein